MDVFGQDVVLVRRRAAVELPPDRSHEAAETNLEVVAVVQSDVGDSRTVHGEVHDEADDVSSAHPRLRVLLVLGRVQVFVLVQNLGDIVTLAGVGPNFVGVDRKVGSVPGVRVVDGDSTDVSR